MAKQPRQPDGPVDRLYGRRKGKPLRDAQQALLEARLPALRVPDSFLEARPADPAGLFAFAPRAIWIEIGFGAGEHLAAQAAANPDVGFIGCEPFLNGVARMVRHVVDEDLANVRILPDDARPLLDALPPASVDRLFLLFPDPWPKGRHAKRRFVGPENLPRVARVLKPGGEWRVASDDPTYQRWSLRHLAADPRFAWQARGPEDWRRRRDDWPATRYEEKALAAGRRPAFFRFLRTGIPFDGT